MGSPEAQSEGDATWLVLKTQEGAMSQGIKWPLGAGKRKGIDSRLKLPGRSSACRGLDLSPVRPALDL